MENQTEKAMRAMTQTYRLMLLSALETGERQWQTESDPVKRREIIDITLRMLAKTHREVPELFRAIVANVDDSLAISDAMHEQTLRLLLGALDNAEFVAALRAQIRKG